MNRFARPSALRLMRLFALLPLLAGVGALVGHALGQPLLPMLRPEYRAMSPVTAVALVLLASGLYAFTAGAVRVCHALALLAGLPMLAVLGSYALDGVDRISPPIARAIFPASTWGGLTSRSAAVAVVLLTVAILARRRARIADPATAGALVLSLTALLGYAYGIEDARVYASLLFNNLALSTALALFLLSLAVFCMRRSVGWSAVVASSYAAGGATRRQLSLLSLPPFVGWAAITAVDAGRLDADAAMGLVVIATVIPMALLVLRDGRRQIALEDANRSRDAELSRVAEETQGRLARQSERLRAESAERAKAEALVYRAQRLEAVGQLTGGIAHDFNNLLMTISGNVQLLERRLPADDPSLRFVQNLRSAVAKGTKVTQQLLAFARSQRLDIRPTAIGPVLASARELIGHSLGPDIEIRVATGDAELWAMCDPDQLELSILNLAVNSRDAMPDGGIVAIDCVASTLPAASANEDDPNGDTAAAPCVLVRVADNGQGMSPEVASRAVEPFFTTKERGKGTGLGLAQVYGFVMQCRGDFRVVTAPGVGTSVELRFPLAAPPIETDPPTAAPTVAKPVPSERRSVLVIDDDAEVREVIVRALDDAGYLVSEAPDGPTGLEALERSEPSAAIIDFLMPGLNGAEVARVARERRPKLPIVFVSGYADTLALEGVSGASVLRKPFDVQTLVRVVGTAIAAARSAETA